MDVHSNKNQGKRKCQCCPQENSSQQNEKLAKSWPCHKRGERYKRNITSRVKHVSESSTSLGITAKISPEDGVCCFCDNCSCATDLHTSDVKQFLSCKYHPESVVNENVTGRNICAYDYENSSQQNSNRNSSDKECLFARSSSLSSAEMSDSSLDTCDSQLQDVKVPDIENSGCVESGATIGHTKIANFFPKVGNRATIDQIDHEKNYPADDSFGQQMADKSKQLQTDNTLLGSEKFEETSQDSIENLPIAEKYRLFKKAIIKLRAPTYIIGSSHNKETNKIYIDVVTGYTGDAKLFLNHITFLLPWIEIVEQERMEYIGEEVACTKEENCAAGPVRQHSYLAREAIEMGNQLLPLKKDIRFTMIRNICEEEKCLEDVMRSCESIGTGTATSAGFVMDQHNRTFKLSVRHPFEGHDENGKYHPHVGYDKHTVKLSVLTEIKTQDQSGKEDGEVIFVGDSFLGAFKAFKVDDEHKAVDIALVRVNDATLAHHKLKLNYKNATNENTILSIFGESDDKLVGCMVEKTGPVTGKTLGRIVFASSDTYIGGIPCGGTFLVQADSSDKVSNPEFAKLGDSGSLVIERLGNQTTGVAFGMCFQVSKCFRDNSTNKCYRNVTRCVRLDSCFQFAKEVWKLELKLYTDNMRASNRSDSTDVMPKDQNQNNTQSAEGKTEKTDIMEEHCKIVAVYDRTNSQQHFAAHYTAKHENAMTDDKTDMSIFASNTDASVQHDIVDTSEVGNDEGYVDKQDTNLVKDNLSEIDEAASASEEDQETNVSRYELEEEKDNQDQNNEEHQGSITDSGYFSSKSMGASGHFN